MGRGVTVGIIIGLVIGGLLAVSFAFPQLLDQSPVNPASQPTTPKQATETGNIISKPEEAPEEITPNPMSLDQVDPYHKTEVSYIYEVEAKTADSNTCRGSLTVTSNVAEAEPPFYQPVYELSPCPYDVDDAIRMKRTCLREDAPLDLRLRIHPDCKEIWDVDRWFFVKQNILVNIQNYDEPPHSTLVSYQDKTGKTTNVKIYGFVINYFDYLDQVSDKQEFKIVIDGGSSKVKLVINHSELGIIEQTCGLGGCEIYVKSTGRTETTGPRVI